MNKAQKCLSAARTAMSDQDIRCAGELKTAIITYISHAHPKLRTKVLNSENLSLDRRLHSLDPIHSKVKATPQQPRSAADPRPPQFNAAFDKL